MKNEELREAIAWAPIKLTIDIQVAYSPPPSSKKTVEAPVRVPQESPLSTQI